MPTFYHNAENALNRANEFCELGKEHEALDCLYDVLKNRKSKMAKEIHEKIISKFLELCVVLKKSQMAKDGLYSYRNICQHVDLKSWEDAVRKYIHLTQSKVESAQEKFQSASLDVDDLDQDLTPEILLKTVSKEGAQDRSERIILLPWIKFLWECHRHCLDLLKTPQTEKLYHTVAQNAFKFCVKYYRKSELRKLCSMLRIYKSYAQKRQAYSKADDSESQLLLCLETGFIELESAISMELWQDAFKAIEDIHSIINISKKFQQSRIMAHYYDKFSCVLWKGEKYLFHAAAVWRYFQILKDQKKNLNLEDITKLACRVFLSILAIPIASTNPVVDLIAETDVCVLDKNYMLLSSLLYLQKCPTRSSLIKDVVVQRVNQYLPKELNDLFQAIEYNLKPTELYHHITSATKYIENYDDLKQYMPLIHKCAVVKLIPVLFNIYTNIKLSKLQYYTGIAEISDLEIILVDSARKYEFPLRIDHRNMSVHFSPDFNIFKNERPQETNNYNNQYLNYLMRTYNGLKDVVSIIYPERLKDVNVSIAENIAKRYKRKEEFYRKRVLLRKTTIEKHKEHLENLRIQKEDEEKRLLAEKVLQFETTEKKRLLRENEERNLQLIQREQEKIKRKILLEKMENLKKSVLGSQLAESVELEDLDNFDPEILFTKQIEQFNKEKKALSSKLRRQDRNFNHLERAKRVEEMPLLLREYNLHKENHFEAWKKDQQNKFDLAHRLRTAEVQKKKRYLEIKSDLENFLKQVKKGRLDAHFAKVEEYLQTLEAEKQRRLKDRAEKRKEAKRNEWNKQQELKRKENLMRTSNKGDVCCAEAKQKREIMKENPPREGSTKSFLYPRFTGSSEGTETITKDKYFYNRTYKLSLSETDRTKSFEGSANLSNFLGNIYPGSKRVVYKSSYYSARGETTLFEKREEAELSWRTSPSRNSDFNSTYTMQNQRFKEDDPSYQKTYIIMQRKETISAQPKVSQSSTDTSSNPQKIIRNEARTNEPEHSRTPWAKLKLKSREHDS